MTVPAVLLAACLAIETGVISAGDLARSVPAFASVPPETVIGAAPGPGARRVFGPAELARLARRFGISGGAWQPACFELRTAVLSGRAVAEAVQSAAGSRRVRIVDWSRTPVPAGVLEFTPGKGELWGGRLRYGEHRTIPVWAKVLGAVDVAKGDMVAVEAVAGGARVSFTGRAETSGSEGDTVVVLREDNRKRIRARVTGKGKVLINADASMAAARAARNGG